MPDMLVKLYELPEIQGKIDKLKENGVAIRRPLPPEKHIVLNWVRENFSEGWASECNVSFSKEPISCFIAVEDNKILGFACYDTTCKDFFGPTGVAENQRGRGIGTVLLLKSLYAMREMGYGYAVIGGAGPVEYYKKICGAVVIEESTPGIYKEMLK